MSRLSRLWRVWSSIGVVLLLGWLGSNFWVSGMQLNYLLPSLGVGFILLGYLLGALLARRRAKQLNTRIKAVTQQAAQQLKALSGERDQLAGVLAGLSEGVVAMDLGQRILHINPSARSMLRLEDGLLQGKHFSDDLPAVDREIKQTVAGAIHKGVNLSSRLQVGTQYLECSVILTSISGVSELRAPELRAPELRAPESPLCHPQGKQSTAPRGALLVLHDVTEKIHLENVRSDFVANASHELKTPISAVRGLVETIIDDPKMPPHVFAGFIERIRQQAIRLDRIVQDLLQLSRFDEPEPRQRLSPINLTVLLQQIGESRSSAAFDAGVAFELQLNRSQDDLIVPGETEALTQMVTNLLDNALKYTPQGGQVQLRLKQAGQHAQIEVEDNGIGIPRDETARVFERFYRLDQARSRDLGGTGLGLAIVKHIAQAHQGRVQLNTRLGKGSTFMVQLPLAPSAQ